MSSTSKCLVVFALLATVCLAAYMLTGTGQSDEIYYLEPGVNLALGRGFVSGYTYFQNPQQTWGCSTPGMPLLYAAWFKLAGFGIIQSKLLSLALHLSGALSIVRWYRIRQSASLDAQLVMFIALTVMPTMLMAASGCRLEVFALLLVAWFLSFAFPINRTAEPSYFSASFFGAVCVFLGLHFAGFYALACSAIFLAKPALRHFLIGLSVAAGMLIAAVGIYLWYNSTGAWQMFVESRAWHYQGHDMPWVATGWRKYVMNPDMTLVALGLVVLVVLGFVKHVRLPSQLVRDARVSLALYFAIPTAISVLGIYYNSYGWMALVPILLLLSRNFEWAISSLPRPATAALLILAACGLAAETSRLLLKNVRVARQAEAAVIALDKMACPDHPVATSPQHYYRLKGRHPRLGVVSSKWPLEVRESFLWIVDTPEMAPLTAQKLGGQWAEVARGLSPADLVVWRRKN